MEKFDLILNGGMGGGEVVGRDEGRRVRRELYSTYDIDTVSGRQWSRKQIEFNSMDEVAMVPHLISDQNRLSLHVKLHGQTA